MFQSKLHSPHGNTEFERGLTMNDFITSYRNEHIDKLIEFYIEHDEITPSYADGALYASYRFTNDYEQTTFAIERLPSGRDNMGEFMASVEDKCGIREILVFDESTGLMEGLQYHTMTDWEIAGIADIMKEHYTIRGLRLRKKG